MEAAPALATPPWDDGITMENTNRLRRPQAPKRHITFAPYFDALPPVLTWPPKPLAIGIRQALQAQVPEGRRSRFRADLYAWTRTQAYSRALAAVGAMRHDAEGKPVEPVSPAHAAAAKRRIRNARKAPRQTWR